MQRRAYSRYYEKFLIAANDMIELMHERDLDSTRFPILRINRKNH